MSIQKVRRRTNGLIWKVVQDTAKTQSLTMCLSVKYRWKLSNSLHDPMDCSYLRPWDFENNSTGMDCQRLTQMVPKQSKRECKHEDSGKGMKKMSTRNQHALSREQAPAGASPRTSSYIRTCHPFFHQGEVLRHCIQRSSSPATSLSRW